MKKQPKAVYIIENGGYTELTYEEFAWNDRVRITYEINKPFNVAKIEKITKVVTLNGFFRCFILNNSIGLIFSDD